MPSVRIYQKKQIRLDRLSFPQAQMFKVGNVGVAAVKNRLAAAQGPTDSSAKPLTKRYAIWKTKIGKGNRRNLMLPSKSRCDRRCSASSPVRPRSASGWNFWSRRQKNAARRRQLFENARKYGC